MLCKRLFKKPGFIAVLAILILLTAAATFLSSGDGGMISVAVFAEDPSEAASHEVITTLTEKKSVVRFIRCSSEEEAVDEVISGRADTAWLFPADLGDRLERFPIDGKPVMRSISRENSVYVMLAAEKLHTALYPRLSFSIFEKFMDKKFDETDDALLERYYSDSYVYGDLVGIEFAGGETSDEPEEYLLSPLRGLLAVAVSLTSAASVMYFFIDRDKGTFAWIPVRKQIYVQLASVIIPTVITGAVALAAIKASGFFTSFAVEAASALLFCVDCALFSILLGRICGSALRLGAVIPAVMLAEIALSPVFLNIESFKFVSYLLPPYHYLTAVYRPFAMINMIIYAAVGGTLCLLTRKRA